MANLGYKSLYIHLRYAPEYERGECGVAGRGGCDVTSRRWTWQVRAAAAVVAAGGRIVSRCLDVTVATTTAPPLFRRGHAEADCRPWRHFQAAGGRG